jgi:predicted O-methyltransferase YrrM
LVRHLPAAKVVETGVARGLTSRIILEAMERSGTGRLWSIDLPATDPTVHDEIAVAVPDRLCRNWTYIAGTSRRVLPKLLEQIAPIDLFVHDSSHTRRNVLFELGTAWAAIRRGAVVADDVEQNAGFASFGSEHPDASCLVAEADDGGALFGIAFTSA